MKLNRFQKSDRGNTSLVLSTQETRDDAQASGEWLASTEFADAEAWR